VDRNALYVAVQHLKGLEIEGAVKWMAMHI